jgi:hypothetical protein
MAKGDTSIAKVSMSEKEFNWGQCNDACATLKLAEGVCRVCVARARVCV